MKKIAILTLIIVLLSGAVFSFFYLINNEESAKSDQKQGQQLDGNTKNVGEINYSPPTEEEVKSGDAKKEELVSDQEKKLANTAVVVISDAGQYDNQIEVRAFAQNIISNGTCTITFTKSSEKIIRKVPANTDATTSPCMALTLPSSEFTSKGKWTVNVTYSNDKVTGTANTELEIN